METVRKKRRRGKKSIVREYTEIIILAVALALFARTFFIQAFRIPSESMEETLLVGDFLFANKLIYGPKIPFLNIRLPGVRDPQPGDIIIFKYPLDQQTDYIKRCVAVAGQTVEMKGTKLYIDGVLQEEPYSQYSNIPGYNRHYGPITIPEGHIFMMGDNRDNSADSRAWGPLPLDLVLGKAMFIYFSWNPRSHSVRFSRIGDIIR
ncbi:MAG: signal peptidase I [Candidatus Latescibacteria bacterium]|nr:signal peptidase I [Candidatus Latescibacterota bacterium]NIM22179.1 signal peptidase I [Candidatus Latescibacterota bacterium]NIM64729.1 signal peptidase I [Candidatus Latescibacterota bacterium]NIO01239.1 signal peptidase I [Candidatus Latescibacterota bacterium]NIO27624.1 signal peptidase I [Candidatus Latescibacterota bacterium]